MSPTESIWFHDSLFRVHVSGEQTGGAFTVLEVLAPSGHMPPPHIHEREGESFLVLEGEITVHTESGATVLRPGDATFSPAGEAHTFQVTGAGTARILVVTAPAGFLDYVRACGDPAEHDALPTVDGPPDLERLMAAADAHGITFIGPPGTVPADFAGAGPR